MKTTVLFTVLALLLSACQLRSTDLSSRLSLDHPERNVLCDQYICADSQGISKVLTEKYLGEGQADQVFSKGSFDTTQFTFDNGVFCDSKAQMCYVDRYFDSDGKRSQKAMDYTKALFAQ
ncbi:Fels-1 prophage protein [Acinetobacter calcoaceticus]|uniref:Fels-1 prophage protein n=1 Tax=Acinetobacter calcoaceticus TaxID=471 RepID=A0A4R1YA44_ACICA|nr:Fels-1 prophage protein [Acinetobacter calcoaceticus]